MEFLSESNRHLDMPEEVEDGKKTEKSIKTCPVNVDRAQPPAMEPEGVSNHHCPEAQHTSVPYPNFPHCRHFTAEEMSSAPGIEAETLPDISSSESIPDLPSSPRSSHTAKLMTCPQSAAKFSDIVPDCYTKGTEQAFIGMVKPDEQPTHSPGTSKLQFPEETYFRSETVRGDSTRQTTSSNREHRSSRTRRRAAKVHEAR